MLSAPGVRVLGAPRVDWILGAPRVDPFFQNPALCLGTHLKVSFLGEPLLLTPSPTGTVWNFALNEVVRSTLGSKVRGRMRAQNGFLWAFGVDRGGLLAAEAPWP